MKITEHDKPIRAKRNGKYWHDGQWLNITELSKHPDCKVPYHTLYQRLHRLGYTVTDAMTAKKHH